MFDLERKKTKLLSSNKGFSLIEMLIYIGIFSLVFVFVLDMVFAASKSYDNFKIMKDLRMNAENLLERIGREIRFANNIDLINSVFSANYGKIYLNTTDETGSPKTLEFFVQSSSTPHLAMRENGAQVKYLNSSSTEITSLVFREIQTATTSRSIRIELGVKAKKGKFEKTENFYTTAILKNSY